MQRVARRCCHSLAKQQSSLSDPLCFCHSSKVGSKTKLLNQRLGSTPGFQARAVKGPLCPLQGFTADSRSETAFQACLYQSNLHWHSRGAPWRGFSPPGCAGARGLSGVHPPPAGRPGCQTFPSYSQLALKQHPPPSACRTPLSYTSFDVWKNEIPVHGRN